ncbi:MAG: hypothetical protein PHV18_11055 [Lachnospiraceae bacterium]|nr:hypothetical protein [Lachnospiraceae bacterium]
MKWTLVTALAVVFVAMYVAEVITKKTKARIPSLLIVSIIFLAGYWSSVFPKDILDISYVNQIRQITLLFILLHVGTMFDINQIKQDWKTVVITLTAVAGIVVIVGGLGFVIFGKEMTVAAIPPLTGGGMASLLMSDAALERGLDQIAMLATLVFVFQGFFGFPLTSFFLRKECKSMITDFRAGTSIWKTAAAKSEGKESTKSTTGRKTLNDLVPAKYKTYTYYLAKLSVISLIVYTINLYTSKYFSDTILYITFGILGVVFGFLEKEPLKKAESYGILQVCLTASFMRNFAGSTPQQLLELIIPILGFLALATVAITVSSVTVGKFMKYSPTLSIAIGLNCFLGFPFNYIITDEAIAAVAETEEERLFLNGVLMPKMIIAGIVAVSIVSTIVAGAFLNLM